MCPASLALAPSSTQTCTNGSCSKFPFLIPHLDLLPSRHTATWAHAGTDVSRESALFIPPTPRRAPGRTSRGPRLQMPLRPLRLAPGTSLDTDKGGRKVANRGFLPVTPTPRLRPGAPRAGSPASALTHGGRSGCPASAPKRKRPGAARAKFSKWLSGSGRRGKWQPRPSQQSLFPGFLDPSLSHLPSLATVCCPPLFGGSPP